MRIGVAPHTPAVAAIIQQNGNGSQMLRSTIVRIVDTCCRFAWIVVAIAVVLTGLAAEYTRRNFAINTDTTQLISSKLPWRQRELEFEKAFPHRADLIMVVIDAWTPELADGAARRLTAELQKNTEPPSERDARRTASDLFASV